MADQPLDPIPIPERYNRRPTIDDVDDVDDEDGTVMEEAALDTDLTLHTADPAEVTGPTGTIARNDEPDPLDRVDRGAANLDDDDLGDQTVQP